MDHFDKLCIWPYYELRGAFLAVPLSSHQGLMMTALLSHKEVTIEIFMETLWPNPDLMPDCWYCSMTGTMMILRRKLIHFDLGIHNRESFGWSLVPK